jgi:hypothetical protein
MIRLFTRVAAMRHLICSALFLGVACLARAQGTGTVQAPFKVTITALKPQFTLGQPVMIHIVMRSISQKPIDVPEERHLGRGELNYRIMVDSIVGSPVPDSDLMRKRKAGRAAGEYSEMERELNNGDEIEEDVDLNNVVKFSTPGDYTVQVERADYRWGPSHIRSNRLVIHIVP